MKKKYIFIFSLFFPLSNFIIKAKLLIRKSVYCYNNVVIRNTIFEDGHNVLYYRAIIEDSMIGFGSYIGSECKIINTKIGRFCSIGPKIEIISGNHPSTKFVSTHPSFYSLSKQAGFNFVSEQKFIEIKVNDTNSEFRVIIGNDVWIGANVLIFNGISIGDGAIIAAGSIITKNVEPYEIVCGVPAKRIRYRFTSEQIDFLLSFKWWDRDLNWWKQNAELFTDIEILKNNELSKNKDKKVSSQQ